MSSNEPANTTQEPVQRVSIPQALQIAGQHAQGGRIKVAEDIYRQILTKIPTHHSAMHGLGLLAVRVGKLALATTLIGKAAQLAPNTPVYFRNLGELLRRQKNLDGAIQAHARAISLAPNDAENHFHMALTLNDKGLYPAAAQGYRRAIELSPQYGLAWNNLGACLQKLGDRQGSEHAYTQAAALNPRHAEAQNNLGAIYSEQGKLDEARSCFEAAIAANPNFVEAHYNLSSLKKYEAGDSHLAILEAIHATSSQLPVSARIRYNFALGKALDDIGQYDRAFQAYAEGNRLQYDQQTNNETVLDEVCKQIPKVFNAAFFKKTSRSQDTRTPIFIVGMPRAGTTLIEQVLSSHKSVFGAGELDTLHELVSTASGSSPNGAFTKWVAGMSDDDYQDLGKAYMERVWALAPDKQYITDKMPANFFYIGIIRRALPNAKIINAMRDPMDSCFSCFSRLFNRTMQFAYNQEALGRYYVRYAETMKHWHSVLPKGTILDLSYEDMVSDFEVQAHRLVDFLGLPWDENCLSFYKNDRLVQTASITQVRKPIYSSSVNRWKHFEKDLQPLMNIVKKYRPKNS